MPIPVLQGLGQLRHILLEPLRAIRGGRHAPRSHNFLGIPPYLLTQSYYSSGDKVFSSVEGTVKTMPKPAGPPEVTFEGKFWYTGGTGKFEGITGGGTYKNTLTPGANYEFEGQYTLKR
jgi:hypothetical protein